MKTQTSNTQAGQIEIGFCFCFYLTQPPPPSPSPPFRDIVDFFLILTQPLSDISPEAFVFAASLLLTLVH